MLVKSIFFDALTKVVTRSSVLLSLFYKPYKRENSRDQNQVYLDMLTETKDTFGALELKAHRLKQNIEPKTMQIILTVFRKHKRLVAIDGETFDFHDTDRRVRVSPGTRQAQWCTYAQLSTISSEQTSRFMLIDKRLHQSFLSMHHPHALTDKDVLQYRSYLYIISDHTTYSTLLVVSFKGNVYVKFPRTYSVLRAGNAIKTGLMVSKSEPQYFATCFDCRRYSCLKPNYLLIPDSQDMIDLMKMHAEAEALSKLINLPDNWPSTPHDDMDALKYVCMIQFDDHPEKLSYWKYKPRAFIEHSANDISEEMQEYMYTLPDIFRNRALSNLPGVACPPKVHYSWWDMTFSKQWRTSKSLARNELWNNLRNSSRYIATETEEDDRTKKTLVKKMLDTSILDGPFKIIIETLRRRILPKPNEDS
jgi:hypothetical protein